MKFFPCIAHRGKKAWRFPKVHIVSSRLMFKDSRFWSGIVRLASPFLWFVIGSLWLSLLFTLNEQTRENTLFVFVWKVALRANEAGFYSALGTLYYHHIRSCWQDVEARAWNAVEWKAYILDGQYDSTAICKERKQTVSHFRRKPHWNDTRWFNPWPVATCDIGSLRWISWLICRRTVWFTTNLFFRPL